MSVDNGFITVLGDIGSFLLELLISALWGLYMIISYLFTNAAKFLENLSFAFLPSASKILKDHVISGTLLAVFLVFIVAINISAFNMFRKDKIRAREADEEFTDTKVRKRVRRISERKLLLRCFFGGALGGYMGMKICRHKTLKPKFRIGVSLMLIVQVLLFSFVLGFFGFWLYLS